MRGYQTDEVTIGLLHIEGINHKPIFTLENPWKNNKTNISCIPKKLYFCAPYSSKKYPDTYQVMDVKDRTYILIHVGNLEKDTKGCVLLGLSAGRINGEAAVLESRKAVAYFKELIGDEDFILNISD